jgi:hypothetical protein
LQPQRNVEIALGFLLQAAFGNSTVIDGLAVTPTSPASLQVKVGPGSIIFATTVDTLTSGFGSLPVDNSDPLVKIGINLTSTTMAALAAPAGAGNSQNWLLEAQFIEADSGAVVLPYYNAANPSVPYTGPANAGTTNNTARTNRVQLQWKGGTIAATGQQVTAAPDAGWVGVAVVTVANGQSTITASNITAYAATPSVPCKLPQARVRLSAPLTLYVSTTGSDTLNSGLTASAPFKTIQNAWNVLWGKFDLNGFSATISVADGAYTDPVVVSGVPLGVANATSVLIQGNATTPSNCAITVAGSSCFLATAGAPIQVVGFKLIGSGGLGFALQANLGGKIDFNNIEFGACGVSHIFAQNQGTVTCENPTNYKISGGSTVHYLAQSFGIIAVQGAGTITLTGTPAFSSSFAISNTLSQITTTGMTFSGSATGQRYTVSANSLIGANAGGATFFPGSTSGVTQTGGQYT